MANEMLYKISKLLKENQFVMIPDIYEDMKCIICNNILINACSAPCGCRYCYECIDKYLDDGEKYCPGNIDYCKETLLNIKRDIYKEQSVNARISKLVVKCPQKSCQFKDELRKIDNHMRVCNMLPSNCPFVNMGCTETELINDDMKKHLLIEIFPHSKLLIEWINNLKNEVEVLNKNVADLIIDNREMKIVAEKTKLDGENKQMAILQLQERDEIKCAQIAQLINENKSIINEINQLKNAEQNKIIANLQLQTTIEQQNTTIEQLKQKYQQTQTKINNIERESMEKQKELCINIDEIRNANIVMTTRLDQIDQSVKLIHTNKINVNEELCDIKSNLQEINVGKYEWIIDNWSDKLQQTNNNTIIYSDPFDSHKNGYKLCLCLLPNRFCVDNGYLYGVGFCIMRGAFDDVLQWPCKIDVTIQLINQDNNTIFASRILKYKNEYCDNTNKYNKPTNERNYSIINWWTNKSRKQFQKVSNKEISTNQSLCSNNKIIIKCSVNMLK